MFDPAHIIILIIFVSFVVHFRYEYVSGIVGSGSLLSRAVMHSSLPLIVIGNDRQGFDFYEPFGCRMDRTTVAGGTAVYADCPQRVPAREIHVGSNRGRCSGPAGRTAIDRPRRVKE